MMTPKFSMMESNIQERSDKAPRRIAEAMIHRWAVYLSLLARKNPVTMTPRMGTWKRRFVREATLIGIWLKRGMEVRRSGIKARRVRSMGATASVVATCNA